MTPHRSLRNRVTYANVAATLALALVAGGGTAYAAGLVDTDDIKKGAVTTPKLAKNAVNSGKVKNGGIKPVDLATPGVSSSVTRMATIGFPASPGSSGSYQTGTATCMPGEIVLGGGFDIDPRTSFEGQPNVIVQDSRPIASGGAYPTVDNPATGWFVDARRNSGNAAATVYVWVVCGS